VRGPEGREETIGYDALVLAPGAYAVRPPIPGIDHPRVRTLRTVPDADTIRGRVQQGAARAVVLGAGFIGLEAAEALRHAGLDVSIVEAAPHVLPVIDAELAAYVTDELRTHGVDVHEGVAARAILDVEGTPVVELADGTVLPADLVILSVGVRPRSRARLRPPAWPSPSRGRSSSITTSAPPTRTSGPSATPRPARTRSPEPWLPSPWPPPPTGVAEWPPTRLRGVGGAHPGPSARPSCGSSTSPSP
jgi:glycine/D-amino acid oxidase-like deaminating enzyme